MLVHQESGQESADRVRSISCCCRQSKRRGEKSGELHAEFPSSSLLSLNSTQLTSSHQHPVRSLEIRLQHSSVAEHMSLKLMCILTRMPSRSRSSNNALKPRTLLATSWRRVIFLCVLTCFGVGDPPTCCDRLAMASRCVLYSIYMRDK